MDSQSSEFLAVLNFLPCPFTLGLITRFPGKLDKQGFPQMEWLQQSSSPATTAQSFQN